MKKMTYRPIWPPDGKYDARFKRWRDVDTQNGPQIAIDFAIDNPDPELNGIQVSTLVDPHLCNDNRLKRICEACLNRPLSENEEVDLDDLADKPALITVENRENGQGDIHARVMDVQPAG